ncbi:CheR family methyltransferase [Aurantibacillus circumpalustris]|uniref:CheR family methyltransferase n=1 Tax=Aurantibacillus circumpalustris TaxID=3036359 RepID=UPI00295AC055|nr:protein-glutamate O-methyltransferase CheR [Aurantibacillus circumpalustris]
MLNDEEINIILKDLLELYYYDFNYYSRDSFKRRINRLFKLEKFQSFSEFRNRLRTDKSYIDHFIDRITVNVTEMFRDVNFFKELRKEVIPKLAKRPFIKVWHAGCSTGEEVYSVAILLHEAGLLEKSEIYATDINPHVLTKARAGIFPVSLMQLYSKNYSLSGGENNFNSYYTTTPLGEKFNNTFSSRMTFSSHSLANEGYIKHFDLIVCRNVLIYFDKALQERAFQLFNISMSPNSFLALGEKETIKFSGIALKYTQLGTEKIWKKN